MIAATPAPAGAPASQLLKSAPSGTLIAGTAATSLVDALLGLSVATAPGSDVPVRTTGVPGAPDIVPFAQTLAAARAPQVSVSSPAVPELISAQVEPTPKAPGSPVVANAMPSPPLFAVPAWLKPALSTVDMPDRAPASTSTDGRMTAPRRTSSPPSEPNDVPLGVAVPVPPPAGTPITLTAAAGTPLDQPPVATDAAGAARRVRVAVDNISVAGGRRGTEFIPGRAIAADVSAPTVQDVAPGTPGPAAPPVPSADPVAQLVQGGGLGDPAGGGGFKHGTDDTDGGPSNGPTSTAPVGSSSERAPDLSSDSLATIGGIGVTSSHSVTPETRVVAVDVRSPHWPKAVAVELVTLSSQKVDTATLRLSPEHLGPVEVHIHLEARVVTLTFSAAHSDTRAALEQALPQLRDGFANAGLTLGQATVQQQMRQPSQNDTGAPKSESVVADDVVGKSETRRVLSLVDEYA